jgi:hypothetical protein
LCRWTFKTGLGTAYNDRFSHNAGYTLRIALSAPKEDAITYCDFVGVTCD